MKKPIEDFKVGQVWEDNDEEYTVLSIAPDIITLQWSEDNTISYIDNDISGFRGDTYIRTLSSLELELL